MVPKHYFAKFNFWNVHVLASIHDSMNRSKIEFIAYIYILL